MAIIYGVSVSTTGFPFNMMESELVNERERTKYVGYINDDICKKI